MQFLEYMLRTGRLQKVSCKKYAGALYGTLSRLAETPLSEIQSPKEFERIADCIVKLESFVTLNKTGNHMYSSALRWYREYLEAVEVRAAPEVEDIQALENDRTITETERLALTKARVGQGQYRRDLIRLWGGKCSVTHYGDTRLLLASHIKPWYLADNAERLDPHNGLLLTPNLDKVFDAGFITFDPSNRGRIVFSNTLREPEALGLSDTMSVPIEDERLAHYLREHKRTVFITER